MNTSPPSNGLILWLGFLNLSIKGWNGWSKYLWKRWTVGASGVYAIGSFAISQEIILKYFSAQYWTLQNCMQLYTIESFPIKSNVWRIFSKNFGSSSSHYRWQTGKIQDPRLRQKNEKDWNNGQIFIRNQCNQIFSLSHNLHSNLCQAYHCGGETSHATPWKADIFGWSGGNWVRCSDVGGSCSGEAEEGRSITAGAAAARHRPRQLSWGWLEADHQPHPQPAKPYHPSNPCRLFKGRGGKDKKIQVADVFRHASVSSTFPCQSVRKSVGDTFEFPLPLNISVQQSSLMTPSQNF